MGTNFAPLVEDLFLFCYERAFMKSFLRENQTDIIEAAVQHLLVPHYTADYIFISFGNIWPIVLALKKSSVANLIYANAKTHRSALSSQSEVIAMLKGLNTKALLQSPNFTLDHNATLNNENL